MKTLWVLIKGGTAFGIGGVYETEELAKNACKTEWDLIGPVQINEQMDGENWENSNFPLHTPKEKEG